MRSIKKWLVLFLILIFPYIIVQIVERSTHNILTLGYVEKIDLDLDSLGEVIESVDSLKVPEFKLINQEKKEITNQDLLGFNYIVNFFFTSCPTICPTTTLNLIELQNKINKYEINNFKIISVSVDPENDTPQKLKEYAISMNIDLSNWEFLTGSQQEIYDLVKSGFSLSVGQDSLAPGGVFHSSSITIVDDEGYLRTGIDKKKNKKFVYDGTLYSDIKLLVGEIQRLSITNFKDNYDISKQ
ncbi:MAG: SCO family protein [Flavobacteriales bacterium]|nr:SCO family protein [Flavobacteriales bacterium]